MKKLSYSLYAVLFLAAITILSSCGDDDAEETTPITPTASATFTVTIENVFEAKAFASSGVFNTPDGDMEPGPATPGKAYSFSFNAGKGSYLSFATMFVQSNDLFYAPMGTGMKLYDDNGMPITGDITSSISLWDGGTEVNEEPGVGMNQPLRQSMGNTGMDEMGTVELVSSVMDGFTYPTTMETIKVMVAHDGGTMFTVTISNISDMGSFASPLAPGVYAVHGMGGGFFSAGNAAMNGLEGLAEDGDPSGLGAHLSDNSGLVSPFAPGIYSVLKMTEKMFTNGAAASAGLEDLAEDGDPTLMSTGLTGKDIVNGIYNTPVGASAPAPIFPGESYEFTFMAEEGQSLNIGTMFIQSNDLFYAFGESGIALFSNGSPVSGDITGSLQLWDAGTEVNEYPGAGNNQAPRQAGMDTGMNEGGNVMVVNDGFTYPMTSAGIKVTISAN